MRMTFMLQILRVRQYESVRYTERTDMEKDVDFFFLGTI